MARVTNRTTRPDEAIVLAGGQGTRLRGVLGDIPKPMAPIAGRPFLAWLLDALRSQGIGKVILSVGYRREIIQGSFDRRYRGIELSYAAEDEPLGTGGAIRLALGRVEGHAAFVLNGDTYQDIDYGSLFRAWAEAADTRIAVTLRFVADTERYGRALVAHDRLARLVDKGAGGPGLINAGVYLVAKNLMAGWQLPDRFSFERDFLQPHLNRLYPAIHVAGGTFIDIGVPDAFEEAQRLIPRLARRRASPGASGAS